MNVRSTLAAMLLVYGCGGSDGQGGSRSDAGNDAGDVPDAQGDASVRYRGVTQGGRVPDAPDYMEPAPDDGPFEVETTCCDRTLAFDALPGETQAVLEADFDVLDGVETSLSNGKFTTQQCMPTGTAIQYRLVVSSDTDAGVFESPRADAAEPSFEDAEGERWNLFVLQSCD